MSQPRFKIIRHPESFVNVNNCSLNYASTSQSHCITGNGAFGVYDGEQTYGLTVAYDLGGGASVNMGVAQSYGRDAYGTPGADNYIAGVEDATIADFGIKMEF